MNYTRYSLPPWQRQGLVGYWPLDGNAKDHSLEAAHGAAQNAAWSAGPFNGRGSFAPTGSSYIDCSGVLNTYLVPITMMAWVYFGQAPSWGSGVFPAVMGNFGTSPSNYSGIGMLFGDDSTAYQGYIQAGGSGSQLLTRYNNVTANTGWHHYCFTATSVFLGSAAHAYIDGCLSDGASTDSGSGLQSPTNSHWEIGRWTEFASITKLPSYARVAEARVYNYAMTAQQVYACCRWRPLSEQPWTRNLQTVSSSSFIPVIGRGPGMSLVGPGGLVS